FEKLLGNPSRLNGAADNEVYEYTGEHSHWGGQYRRQKSVRKGYRRLPLRNEKRREAELSCAFFAHNVP
ncbi:hypothetical protein, partial [Mesorhizobium sp. M7A.F.Ca.US.005.03.1.1]|uniref:hypothetical protein n=1 Tax=Mesorhizobium sp. M7A.F.Ca.US.005.03.1.1 TaxID=2496736 RepID=UPI0019D1880D